MLYTNEADASLFATDTSTQCAFNITPSNLETESVEDMNATPQNNTGIHFHSKHRYRDTFGDAHIQYQDFDNGDAFIYRDKSTALLQQELQNPYWCLHDPVTTKSYQVSTDMDIKTMPHAMYFSGNTHTVTKINHVPYQTIQYILYIYINLFIIYIHVRNSCSLLTYTIIYINIYTIGYC